MYLKLIMATSLLISTTGEPFTYEPIERTNKAPYKIKEFELPNKYNSFPTYVSDKEKINKMIEDLERIQKEKEEAEEKARKEHYEKLAERFAEVQRIKAEEERKAREEAERLRKIEEEKQKQRQSRSRIVENNPSVSSNARTLTVNASAYTYAENDPYVSEKWGNKTFTGKDVRFGYVAVDPNVIPLGTRMKIEGFGDTIFTAEDTGNWIVGNKIDIFLPSYEECIQFGRKNIKIYILN